VQADYRRVQELDFLFSVRSFNVNTTGLPSAADVEVTMTARAFVVDVAELAPCAGSIAFILGTARFFFTGGSSWAGGGGIAGESSWASLLALVVVSTEASPVAAPFKAFAFLVAAGASVTLISPGFSSTRLVRLLGGILGGVGRLGALRRVARPTWWFGVGATPGQTNQTCGC
jgi:hypothetical protein